jgi:hypothetical protein
MVGCFGALQFFILFSCRALGASWGAGAGRAFSDHPQRLIRWELMADHLTTRRPVQ